MKEQRSYHPLDCPLCGSRMVFDCKVISCNHCKVSARLQQPEPSAELPLITVTKCTLPDGTVTLT